VDSLITIVKYSVFAVVMLAVLAAVASWLVRTRKVRPFSPLGRALRTSSDFIIKPVERRVVRRGGNPLHAGFWLIIVVAVAGLGVLAIVKGGAAFADDVHRAFTGGFREMYRFIIGFLYGVMFLALVMRIIGTWFGVFEHTRWMRPAYWLTDPIVKPIRRFMPPIGNLDVSPIIAWLALLIIRGFLLAVVR